MVLASDSTHVALKQLTIIVLVISEGNTNMMHHSPDRKIKAAIALFNITGEVKAKGLRT